MNFTFTQGDYAHIKESGFNPQICKECQEIDRVLRNLSTNITSDLYEALKQIAVLLANPLTTRKETPKIRIHRAADEAWQLTLKALAQVESK